MLPGCGSTAPLAPHETADVTPQRDVFQHTVDDLASDLVSQLPTTDTRLVYVAVPEFDNINLRYNESLFALILRDEVLERLTRASRGRHEIVEREHLEKVMRELTLSTSLLFDSDNAQRVGKLVSADVLILGRIYDHGSDVELRASLVDVETGTRIGASSAHFIRADTPRSFFAPPPPPAEMEWYEGPVPEHLQRDRAVSADEKM